MDLSGFFDTMGQLNNAYGQYQGTQNAGQVNQNVQQSLGQNANTLAQQIAALQGQIGQGQGVTQDAYNQAQGLYGQQNQQLQGNIDTMTASLTGLSDPNSPYMQQLRQKVERADAAAGRRSQVGEREVQLAAMLADYVGKYAPGLQNSITGARNQMQTNTSSLADLYARMTGAGTQQQQTLNQLLQQQQQLAQAQNTTGRQAANASTNNNTALIGSLLGAGKGLAGMFGSGSGAGGNLYTGGDADYSMGASNYSPWVSTYGGFGDAGFNTGLNNDTFLGAGGNLFGDYDGGTSSVFSDDFWR